MLQLSDNLTTNKSLVFDIRIRIQASARKLELEYMIK